MSNFVTQIEFNRQSENAWSRLVPVIESVVVEDAQYVRDKVQERNADDSAMPSHHYTIGRTGRTATVPIGNPVTSSTSPASAVSFGTGYGAGPSEHYGDSHNDVPLPPPSSPPPVPTSQPPANPFGDNNGGRKQSYAFTDEEGDGGDEGDEEVEEV